MYFPPGRILLARTKPKGTREIEIQSPPPPREFYYLITESCEIGRKKQWLNDIPDDSIFFQLSGNSRWKR